MAFWSRFFGDGTPPPDPNYKPGDPDGVELTGTETEEMGRSLPGIWPSPWDGWPGQWWTPEFQYLNHQIGMERLTDVAWAAIDLNSSVLASMPVYRLQSGIIVDNLPWMINPDPDIYTSWAEFAKQVFWDFHLAGEVFILPMSTYSDGKPRTMRVVPPWLINVEMSRGTREYNLGGDDVTDEILHIRYHSTTDDAHGHGPLEVAGARILASELLTRYATKLAETGGTPHYWIDVEKFLNQTQADDLLDMWVESRKRRAGEPALLSGGAKLNQLQSMNARDMALLELSQFNEARISTLLGVPPFLLGLPMAAGESMTYSNVNSLFDFHDRSSLRPKANAIMQALSWWALPNGQAVELNRDEYSRPDYATRASANATYINAGVLTADEVRHMERFYGPAAAVSLTGGQPAPAASPPPSPPSPLPAGRPPPESVATRSAPPSVAQRSTGHHGGGNPYHDKRGRFTTGPHTNGDTGAEVATQTTTTQTTMPWGSNVNRDKLPPNVLDQVTAAYNKISAKYPQIQVDNIRVGDVEAGGVAETIRRDAYTTASYGTHYGRMTEIVFDEKSLTVNEKTTEKDYLDSIASGYHPPAGPNSDIFGAITTHELGHVLAGKTTIEKYDVVNKLTRMWYESNPAEAKAAAVNEKTHDESLARWVRNNVSGYALDAHGHINPSEAIAEAFQDVEMNGDKAKAGSKAIHELLIKDLEKWSPRVA